MNNDKSFDPNIFYLGNSCKYEHDWDGDSHSLRYVNNSRCSDCNRERLAAYKAKNKERVALSIKQWGERNPEKRARAARESYERNKEQSLKRSQKRRQANLAQSLLKEKSYRLANLEKAREYREKVRRLHPEAKKNRDQRRRAKKRQVSYYDFSSADLRDRLAQFDGCVYCGEVKPNMHLDHFLSLSSGGSHVLSNLVVACSSCNCSKRDRDPYEWFSGQPFFSQKQWKRLLKLLGKTQKTYAQIPLL